MQTISRFKVEKEILEKFKKYCKDNDLVPSELYRNYMYDILRSNGIDIEDDIEIGTNQVGRPIIGGHQLNSNDKLIDGHQLNEELNKLVATNYEKTSGHQLNDKLVATNKKYPIFNNDGTINHWE